MSYIDLLNAFYVTIQCSQVSNNGQLLYHTLLMINNKSSWSDWFSRTNVSIYSMMNVSERAFINARAELKRLKLIDFVTSKKRGECTKYRILYPTDYSTKEGTKASSKEVQTQVQSADINRIKTKTKTKDSLPMTVKERDNRRGPQACYNRFDNFEQPKTDYDALVMDKLRARINEN